MKYDHQHADFGTVTKDMHTLIGEEGAIRVLITSMTQPTEHSYAIGYHIYTPQPHQGSEPLEERIEDWWEGDIHWSCMFNSADPAFEEWKALGKPSDFWQKHLTEVYPEIMKSVGL